MCHHTSLADALLRISTHSPWIFVCFMNKAIRKDRTELKGTMGFTGTDDSVMSKCIEYGMFINFGAGKRYECVLKENTPFRCILQHNISFFFCLISYIIPSFFFDARCNVTNYMNCLYIPSERIVRYSSPR